MAKSTPDTTSARAWLWPLLITTAALAARVLFAIHPMIDSDQAIIGLMARHILDGQLPVFFWGAPYSSPIESYLAAPVFALFGAGRHTLCLTIILESMAFLWLAYLSARDMWGRAAGLWAMAFAALPPWYFLYFNSFPRTSYLEICTVALALAWLAWRQVQRGVRPRECFWYGLAAGLGFWFHTALSIYAIIPSGLYLLAGLKRRLFGRPILAMAAAFLLGSLPLWAYNLQHHWSTFTHMMRAKPGAGALEVLASLFKVAIPSLLGVVRDGTSVPVLGAFSWLMLALAGAGLLWLLWLRRRGLAGLLRLDFSHSDGSEIWLLYFATIGILLLLYGETAHATRRHFVPLFAGMIPLAGYLLSRLGRRLPWLALMLGALALGYNLYGVLNGTRVLHPQLEAQYQHQMQRNRDLFAALDRHGLSHGYCLDFWDAFQLSFDAGERFTFGVIGDPTYPPYVAAADRAPRKFYIMREPYLAGVTRALAAMGTAPRRFQAGSLVCLYSFNPTPRGLAALDLTAARATASPRPDTAGRALDGAVSRWSPWAPQAPGQELTVDLGRVVPGVCMLRLLSGTDTDVPRRLAVLTSLDGRDWRPALDFAGGWGLWHWIGDAPRLRWVMPVQDLFFPPRPARFVRLCQQGSDQRWFWSVQELGIYRAAGGRPPAVDAAAVVARARRLGVRMLYGDEPLDAACPPELRPPRQRVPKLRRRWSLADARFLPAELSGVAVAVRPRQGPLLEGFLRSRGMTHRVEPVGGYLLFSGLGAPPRGRLVFNGERLLATVPGEEP